MNKQSNHLKPIALSVFFALVSIGAHAAQPSPFAAAPNYLTETASTKETIITQPYATTQTEKRISTSSKKTFGGVKPNIMLFLDDSTSMDNREGRQTRTEILSNALKNTLSPNHKDSEGKLTNYLDKANWGITPFNMIGKDRIGAYPLRMPSFGANDAQYEQNSKENARIVKQRFVDGSMWRVQGSNQAMSTTTPFITRYIDAVAALDEGIHYRCQKNYLIALTDGAANFPFNDYNNKNFFWSSTNQSTISWNFVEGNNSSNDYTKFLQDYYYLTYTYSLNYFSLIQLNRRLNLDNAQVDSIGNLNLKKTWHKVLKAYQGKAGYEHQGKSFNQTPLKDFCHSDFWSSQTNYRYFDLSKSALAVNCNALKDQPELVYYPYTGSLAPYFEGGERFANPNLIGNYQYWSYHSQYYLYRPFTLFGNKHAFPGYEYAYFMIDPNQFNIHKYQTISGKTVYDWANPSLLTTKRSYFRFPVMFDDRYPKQYAGDMFRYLSEPLAAADLRTDADGVDKTGKPWEGNQNIQTFSIAFGSEVRKNNNVLNFLRNGASKKAGTMEPAYWEATSEKELTDAFAQIFQQIAQENPEPGSSVVSEVGTPQLLNQGTPSPAAPTSAQSISEVPTYTTAAASTMGSSIANMAATVYLPAGLKSSELRFYSLNDQAQADTSQWRVPDFSQRKAIIHSGKSVAWVGDINFTNAFFNLSGKKADGSVDAKEYEKALLPWTIRSGNDSAISRIGYETLYRVRPTPPNESPRDATKGVDEYNMGDVLDTPVQAMGENGEAQGNRQEFLVTAANDGMVYLFQSNPDSNANHPYSLKLNYLPATMPRSGNEIHAHLYKDLAHQDYTKTADRPHLYMINGGITTRTTAKKGNVQQLLMVGTLGQGGRGLYALNVGGKDLQTGEAVGLHASQSKWTSSVPLFELHGTDDTYKNLGYTIGYPQVGRIAAEHQNGKPKNGISEGIYYASFLASGFEYPNQTQQETALYIQDLLGVDVGGRVTESAKPNGNQKGKLLAKIAVPNGQGGLASPTLLDVNQDGIYDFAFAGDYGGNMYRFDLRKINFKTGHQEPGVVKRIYTGNPKQPITTAPAISYEKGGRYVIMFGTGSDIYIDDFYNNEEQAIYGIYQRFNPDNRNPVDINMPERADTAIAPDANALLEQTLSTVDVNGTKMRNLTDLVINNQDTNTVTHPGWKIRLGLAQGMQDGERVVVQPYTVLNTLVISTRIYSNTTSNENTNWDAPWSEANKDDWMLVSELDTNHKEHPWTDWAELKDESGTTTTGGNDVCEDKVENRKDVEQRTKTTTFDHVITYRKTRNIYPQTSGWTLAINAENGGAISLKDGFGIDFLKEYTSLESAQSSTKNNGYFFAGSYNTSSSNSTFITGSSSVFGKAGTSMNSAGASLNTGEDDDLKTSNSKPRDCLSSNQNFILSSTTGTGLGETYRLYGKICIGFHVRRLSWHEIF